MFVRWRTHVWERIRPRRAVKWLVVVVNHGVRKALVVPAKVQPALCSGKVDALYLLKAFEFGADAVFVAGCADGECHNEKGSTHAGQRVGYVKKLLDEIGIGAARLEMFHLSPGQCADLTASVAELSAAIQDLGPSPVKES